jgi:hypothetical protein
MRLTFWLKGFCGVASLLVMAALPMAATEQCQTGPPTPASYTRNFPKEASALLQQMGTQAIQVRDLADQLQTFNRDGALISWEMDADVLTQAQAQVNAMDEELCRLRLIRRVTLPWQQKAIDRVAPKMIELTDYVEDALQNLNEKHNTVNTLDRSFAQDADFMYRRADTIARSIGNFEEYAAARTEIQQLSPKLGMHAGS